jgi:hypothetical protein
MDLIGDNLGQGLIKPAFSGIRLEEGAVMLYCSDGYTAGWINSITGDLTPWDGARLKAVSAQELSRGVEAIFTAPDILKKKTSNTTCQSANATGKEAQAGSEKSDLASTSGTVAKPGQAVGGDTPKATRLSGAQARKRQRAKLIARNINSELQQQGRSTPVKRSRAELTPETPEKDQAAKRYRQQAAGPSYSGATSAVKMAIIHPDHPEVEITEEQSLLIQASIMDLIGDNLGQGLIKPAFSGIRLEEGAVMLYCSDGYTAGWINSITGDLTPWDGARLKAVSATRTVPRSQGNLHCPRHLEEKTSEDILRKVDGQNEGLSTSKWKVISAEELEKGKRMVVRIDRDSWSTIEARGRHINLAFGRVPITSLERKSKP